VEELWCPVLNSDPETIRFHLQSSFKLRGCDSPLKQFSGCYRVVNFFLISSPLHFVSSGQLSFDNVAGNLHL
jgi:hypothetical protein